MPLLERARVEVYVPDLPAPHYRIGCCLMPIAFSTNFERAARYADELKQAAFDALNEETVLVAVGQIYHAS